MHGFSIAHQLIREAERYGNISLISLEAGELASISADDIEGILKSLTNWKIEVVKKKALVKCKCGFKGNPKIVRREHDLVFFICPECSKIPRVISGKNIILKKVVVE